MDNVNNTICNDTIEQKFICAIYRGRNKETKKII